MSTFNRTRSAQTVDSRGVKRFSKSFINPLFGSYNEGMPRKKLRSSVVGSNRSDKEQGRNKLLSLKPEALESLPRMPPAYYKFSDGLEWWMRDARIMPLRIERSVTIPSRNVPATGLMGLPDDILRMIFDELDWHDWYKFMISNSRLYNVVTKSDYRRAVTKPLAADESSFLLRALESLEFHKDPRKHLRHWDLTCFSCFRQYGDLFFFHTRATLPFGTAAWKRQCLQCRLQAQQTLHNQAPRLVVKGSVYGDRVWELHPFCGTAVEREWEDVGPGTCAKCRDVQLKANRARADWIVEHGLVGEAVRQARENRGKERPPPGERAGAAERVKRLDWVGDWLERHEVGDRFVFAFGGD